LRAAARVHGVRCARDEGGAPGRRRLLEAPRGRAHLRLRPADVHDRRRHRPSHPADRDHPSVRVVRRLVGGRELRAARGPPPRLPPRELRLVNKRISQVALVALILLAALIVATTYWQTWASAGLAARQDNEIQRVAQFTIDRGVILASNGKTVLAKNVKKKLNGQNLYFRTYPTG